MAEFHPNSAGFLAALKAAGLCIQKQAAPAMAEALRESVARGTRSGNSYFSGLVASAPGEYPQEVTSRLRSSVGSTSLTETSAAVGFINSPPDYAMSLEFKPTARGGRQPVTKALRDEGVLEAGRNALR